MKIHFIAVGGTIMHNLAIVLKERGYEITGSDDEIFEPSHSKLQAAGLLPAQMGWNAQMIHQGLDAVIVGMHARADNPELLEAQRLGLKIYSFPAFLYQQAANKQRIVVAGSHGKTTVTSMILHVLHYWGKKMDYLVGAIPASTTSGNGSLDKTIHLTEENPFIVMEGDEYPSSALDKTPKFLHYHHHIGILTGIAWDHINAFPTEEVYLQQFRAFVQNSCKAGTLIYCAEDKRLAKLVEKTEKVDDVVLVPYKSHPHKVINGVTYLLTENREKVPLKIFGGHNMQNISAALELCKKLSIRAEEFYEAIQGFEGASRRMELVGENDFAKVYRDFAHSPSKLQATVKALKEQYPARKLVACLELHTYSSLNKQFLPQYRGAFQAADVPIVYFNPATLSHKRMEPITEQDLKEAFGQKNLLVFTDSAQLEQYLLENEWKDANLLLMSSGTFNNMEIGKLSEAVLQ